MQPSPGSSVLRDTVAGRVAEQLRLEIADGTLVGGTPLRQNEVAIRFGVSSTPVREAFQILERIGLVRREDRRGVRVFRPSVHELVQSFDVRAILESQAARRAASRLQAHDLDRLAELLVEMDEPSLQRDAFLRLNGDFHGLISDAAGNRRLSELITNEQTTTATYMQYLGVEPASRADARLEHRAVLEALREGDADAAGLAMERHLQGRFHALEGRLGVQEPAL